MALTFFYLNTNVHTKMQSHKLQICGEIEDNGYEDFRNEFALTLSLGKIPTCDQCRCSTLFMLLTKVCGFKVARLFIFCSPSSVDQLYLLKFVFHSQMYGEILTEFGPPLTYGLIKSACMLIP